MTEMTSLKKRMTKRGSCRSPEASLTEHLFPSNVRFLKVTWMEVEVKWDCDANRMVEKTER